MVSGRSPSADSPNSQQRIVEKLVMLVHAYERRESQIGVRRFML